MLRTVLAACLAVASISTFAAAQDAVKDAAKPADQKVLKVGEKAPTFRGVDDAGKVWKSKDHVGKKIIVVYFYPGDMTPGCTKEACAYRDAADQFKDADVEVIGVSGDSVENHQHFKREQDLNFTLLADPKGKVARAFGVKTAAGGEWTFNKKADGKPVTLKRDLTAMRWTFVIDKDGAIVHKDEKADYNKDAATVLKVIEELREKEADKSGS